MSMIIPYVDEWLYPETNYYSMVPQTYGILSNVFDEGFRELQKMERDLGEKLGDMSMDSTNGCTYRCSVAGYCPEELQVNIEGNELVIQGEHKISSRDGQKLQRCFTRRFTIPEGSKMESIQCNINEKGQLEVIIPPIESIEQPKTHHIPIGFKHSTTQKQIESSKKGKKALKEKTQK